MPVTVNEITMVAPDIVRVEIRDASIIRGQTATLGSPDAGVYNSWLTRNNPLEGGISDKAQIISLDKKTLRFQDKTPDAFYDRAAGDVAANYGLIGNRIVTAVYRKTLPYDSGTYSLGASTVMRHYLFLQLDGILISGSYTIKFPIGTGIANTLFDFDDKITRCSSIHGTFIGHRPSDVNKLGYLSEWIPFRANEGVVDFITDYNLSTFSIINDNNIPVFTGNITLKAAPTTPDTLTPTTLRYASTNRIATVTAITAANPGVVTAPAHGFSEGEILYAGNWRGITQRQEIKATNVTVDTFELFTTAGVAISTIGQTFNAAGFASGAANKVYGTHVKNKSATYVFWLDYSSWTPLANGLYRIYIPSMGVSDAFPINDHVWYDYTKIIAGGEYNCRSGFTPDGRFGYTHPVAMKAGTNNFRIFQNAVPLWATSQGLAVSGQLTVEFLTEPSWMSSVEVLPGGAEHMDAGDWDVFPFTHCSLAATCLNIYDLLSSGSRNIKFGTPKASECCNAIDYSSLDSEADLLHIVAWQLDWLLRNQGVDGSVPSGLDGRRQASLTIEPSWFNLGQWYACAPDHLTAFVYAGCAAMFGRIVRDLGHTALGTTFLNSAIAAFNYAEDLYQRLLIDPTDGYSDFQTKVKFTTTFTGDILSGSQTITNVSSFTNLVVGMQLAHANLPLNTVVATINPGASSLTFRNLGDRITANGVLVVASATGAIGTSADATITMTYPGGAWSNAQWNSGINTLNNIFCKQRRVFTVGALYRATGNNVYGALIDTTTNGQSLDMIGWWEYFNTPGADATKKLTISGSIKSLANSNLINSEAEPYRVHAIGSFTQGVGALGNIRSQVLAYFVDTDLTNRNRRLAAMQAAIGLAQGANQQGIAITTGVGPRPHNCPLHNDIAGGGITPPPPGITLYGFSGILGGFLNAGVAIWSNLSFSSLNDTYIPGLGEATFDDKRVVDPYRYCYPGWHTWENGLVIGEAEWTIGQTFIGPIEAAMFLHGWDGNTITSELDIAIGHSFTGRSGF